MLSLRSFLGDRRGLAAMEFALIAPLLAALIVFGADGWLRTSQLNDMRSALQSGMRYYQLGGADDSVAQTLATNSWVHPPADASTAVARACLCGSTPTDCTLLCAGSNPPQVFITMTTSGTFTGLMHSRAMSQNEVLRVR
jgi:Flp pilus assembly protein TadG